MSLLESLRDILKIMIDNDFVAKSCLDIYFFLSQVFFIILNHFIIFFLRRVAVPDDRYDFLCEYHKPARYVSVLTLISH